MHSPPGFRYCFFAICPPKSKLNICPTMTRSFFKSTIALLLATAFAIPLPAQQPALGGPTAPAPAPAAPVTPAVPQAVLDEVIFTNPPGAEPVLRADFSLLRPERIAGVEAVVNGKPLEKDKIKFWSADLLTDHKSAVLFLVDNTVDMVAEESLPRIKMLLEKFAAYAERPGYAIGVSTFDKDATGRLAPMGARMKEIVEAAAKIDGKGITTEGYRSAITAIGDLKNFNASRKFLVIMSNGRFEDTAYKHEDVVKAALDAKVVIYGLGFPAHPKLRPDGPAQVQRLERLAADTKGQAWRADPATRDLPPDLISSMMGYVVAGGRIDLTLTGQTAPLTIEYKITAESKQLYTFSTKLAALPVPSGGPAPLPPGTAAVAVPGQPAVGPQTGTPPGANTAVVVPDPPSIWKRLQEHPVLAGVAGVALLFGIMLLLVMLRRAMATPAPLTYGDPPPPGLFPPLMIDEPEMPDRTVLKPARTAMAWLEALDAENTRFDIDKTAVRIGRKPDNDIVIKNDSVSGHHAEIIRRGEQFTITDLDSPNHVYINNKRVEKSNLEHNDLLELGEVRFRFLRADRV